jgi:hypothetical protein
MSQTFCLWWISAHTECQIATQMEAVSDSGNDRRIQQKNKCYAILHFSLPQCPRITQNHKYHLLNSRRSACGRELRLAMRRRRRCGPQLSVPPGAADAAHDPGADEDEADEEEQDRDDGVHGGRLLESGLLDKEYGSRSRIE